MFRRKKREVQPDVDEALLAQQRAHDDIQKVRAQDPEVVEKVAALEHRRRRNNFGDALVIAMQKREP